MKFFRGLLKTSLVASCVFLFVSCTDTVSDSDFEEPVEEEDDSAGSHAGPVVFSLHNERLASYQVNLAKARKLHSDTSRPRKLSLAGEIKQFEWRLASNQLSRGRVETAMAYGKKLASLELRRGADRDLSNAAKLEIAMTAIRDKKFALAEMLINSVLESKSRRIKASAYNSLGILHLLDGNYSEAVFEWKKAIRFNSNHKAALLNLGFTYLYFGHYGKAIDHLEKLPDSWYAQSGLVAAYRHTDNIDAARTLCKDLLEAHSKHKATVFNCALVSGQNMGQKKKALQEIAKAQSLPGGPRKWNESAQRAKRSL